MHRIWDGIAAAFASWHQTKLFIEHSVAIDHDTLHLMAGMLLWLVIAAILRRCISTMLPWLWILAFTLFNEVADLLIEKWPDFGAQYGEGAKDLLLTMFIPTVLILAARFFPGLFVQWSPPPSAEP